ncbi:hypothetical protein NA56DRAFT_647360 [Hyaloscypha hepaticicola]|uniref:Uncharacterized protein n=1 Tax=Hyaloscypha hepaticicola TaxID=2082293 RepID=A0A2J6PZ40_9HELO|nr:hypothetical protein NA56DRAFT_647360 [Hyaloscypha hepaticicola]
MGGRRYSNNLQTVEAGPRTFLDYNWVRGENDWNAWLYYWAEVMDELEIGSKEGGYYNRGTKNNP